MTMGRNAIGTDGWARRRKFPPTRRPPTGPVGGCAHRFDRGPQHLPTVTIMLSLTCRNDHFVPAGYSAAAEHIAVPQSLTLALTCTGALACVGNGRRLVSGNNQSLKVTLTDVLPGPTFRVWALP